MGHVPPQGLPSLVHWRRHGRDGIHRSRVQHERFGIRIPTVPGRHRRRRRRVREMESPVSCFSLVFNPEGKIVYESVGGVVDRHEGNTQGQAAVFGMLHTAGVKLPKNLSVLAFFQKLGHVQGNTGRAWSKKALIPKWWKSESRGA